MMKSQLKKMVEKGLNRYDASSGDLRIEHQGAVKGRLDRFGTSLGILEPKKIRNEKRHLFRFPSSETHLQIYGKGLGDEMIIRQFGQAFEEYLSNNSDPVLGEVIMAFGAMEPAFYPKKGDINVYWWTSFGYRDDQPETYLEHYLSTVTVKPDLIICLSDRQEREARQLGYDTMQLQFAQYGFRPLGIPRNGLGYAGSIERKRDKKIDMVLGPFIDDYDFETVTDLGMTEQLNIWYNSKQITFGLFKEGQRSWGIVNNRVYEALAAGTPLVIKHHPDLKEVLGIEYPYQTTSRQETIDLVEKIRTNPRDAQSEFLEYSDYVRNNHTYLHRVEKLVENLQ